MKILFALLLFFLTACEEPAEVEAPELTIKQSSYTDLPGWAQDDLSEVVPAFEKSCARIMKRPADRAFGALEASGTYGDWQPLCEKFLALEDQNAAALRVFF